MLGYQTFIQAILLMSILEQIFSFQMFDFIKKTIEKCRWGSGGAAPLLK